MYGGSFFGAHILGQRHLSSPSIRCQLAKLHEVLVYMAGIFFRVLRSTNDRSTRILAGNI
ncbi:hypothetical protein BLAT2472_30152 [Burkholderia latens]